MRHHIFSLCLLALFVAACATSSVSKSEPQPEKSSKLPKLSQSDLDSTFDDYREHGASSVPQTAAVDLDDITFGAGAGRGTGNNAGVYFQDFGMGREDNAGGQFDNNGRAVALDAPSSGIFFNNQNPNSPPVNFNQDIRGRFEHVYDTALGNQVGDEQERVHRAGWIKLDVKKAIKFSGELRKLATGFGATVTAFKSNEVSWKMPGAKLETVIAYFEKREDVELLGYDFRQYDRTGEFYAIEARIKTATLMRDLLLKLADKADKVEDLLKVQAALEYNMSALDGLNAMLKDIERKAGLVELRIVLED